MSARQEVLDANQRLLEAILDGDWETYADLCDPTITAFEPEACGELVEGMEFHQFYFDGAEPPPRRNVTMCAPHVRLLGDVAVVSYIRLVQKLAADGSPITRRCEETRVWHKQDDHWRHVHFHRSTTA